MSDNAIFRHVNQEPASVLRILRITTRPSLALENMSLSQLARNIFAEAVGEEMRDDYDSSTSLLLDGPDLNDGEGRSGTALTDHIQCSGVLKKRRKKMRKHKHKKRLRKNRYKNKK